MQFGTSLSRQHHISLTQQLAVSLEAAIRDRMVGWNGGFPSSREVADTFGVDRGTARAALTRLQYRGLLNVRPGRRPHIAPLPEFAVQGKGDPTQSALQAFFRAGWENHRTRASLLQELELATGVPAYPLAELTLCEPRPGLRAVLTRELEMTTDMAVRQIPWGRLTDAAGPVFLRRELVSRVRRAPIEMIPLRLAGGTEMRKLVSKSNPSGAGGLRTAAVLSGSTTIRDYALELAACDFAAGVSCMVIDPSANPTQTLHTLEAASIVLHDVLCAPNRMMPRKPVVPIHLLPTPECERIRHYLGTSDLQLR